MKTLLPLALIAATVSLGACATVPRYEGGPLRMDGQAQLGQPTRVGTLVATPQAVVEDSRCPMNARCIWAGRLIVTTRIDGPGWRETASLTLGQPYPTHGTEITLTSGTPEKMAGASVPQAAMTFGFEGGR